jgi:hypothetical protein
MLVAANNPTGLPGDTLHVVLASVTDPVLTPGAVGAGTYTFTGAQPVGYSGIETRTATYPGDYDFDGVVDEVDYVAWKSNYGTNVVPGTLGDGNWDGVVDLADYTVWRNHLGAIVAPGALTLAEPARVGGSAVDPVGSVATSAAVQPKSPARSAPVRFGPRMLGEAAVALQSAAMRVRAQDLALDALYRSPSVHSSMLRPSSQKRLSENSTHEQVIDGMFATLVVTQIDSPEVR